MSKKIKNFDGRNVNEEIKNQFNNEEKGDEEMNENNEAMVTVEEKKGWFKNMNVKKVGIGAAVVTAIAVVGFAIFKIATGERTEEVTLDTDWEDLTDTVINPE
jgi:hypothetical protein